MKRDWAAPLLRVICAMLFLAFTFVYLYFYQADLMTATQHLLSGGRTHYDRTIGAVLITVVLYIMHLGVLAATRFTRHAHALSFFPSLLLLAATTGITIYNDGTFTFGWWPLVVVILLVGFAVFAWMVRSWLRVDKSQKSGRITLATYWHNLLLLFVMFFCVGLSSNHNDVLHYRLQVESCLASRDYDGALLVGKKSLVCDSSLTMLRIHALARRHQLGDRLFEYPLCGGSHVMMPDGKSVRPVFYPTYQFVKYPELDFALCSLLLDKNIDAFARLIKANADKFGLAVDTPADTAVVADRLPKHYREALVLYCRQRSNPVMLYRNDVLNADYEDFQKIVRSETDVNRRYVKLRDAYNNTYWLYYFFKN